MVCCICLHPLIPLAFGREIAPSVPLPPSFVPSYSVAMSADQWILSEYNPLPLPPWLHTAALPSLQFPLFHPLILALSAGDNVMHYNLPPFCPLNSPLNPSSTTTTASDSNCYSMSMDSKCQCAVDRAVQSAIVPVPMYSDDDSFCAKTGTQKGEKHWNDDIERKHSVTKSLHEVTRREGIKPG